MYIQQRNRLNMFDVYSCIITVSYLASTSDPTLTEQKVNRVMGEVRDWREVGDSLDVPGSRLRQIKDKPYREQIYMYVYMSLLYFLAEVKRLNIDIDCLPAGTCILKQIKEKNDFKHVHIISNIYITICWASIQPPFE